MTMTAILIFLGVYFIFDVIYTINNIIQIKKLKKLLKKLNPNLSN